MAIEDDLRSEVKAILREQWQTRDGRVVPEPENLSLGNDAIKIDAVVLYADLDESTKLVDNYKAPFAAEVYKCFLHCAARIIRDEGGVITAYDGDRIMAVFLGDNMYNCAARTGLKINYAREKVINPSIIEQYPNSPYEEKHVVGIDKSALFIARTGVRGANDLVWVGRSANHAAKLCTLGNDYPTRITDVVFKGMDSTTRLGANGAPMWEERTWTDMGRTIYRSNWWWEC